MLEQVYDLCKWGPTSANCCPMRLVFVKSKEAKERLKPCLDKGNVEKTMAAPVIAIIGYDLEFYNLLPKLFPHADMKKAFEGKPELIQSAAFRKRLAARRLFHDCGARARA